MTTAEKWFRAGNVCLILFGLVHLSAVFRAAFAEPSNEREARFVAAAKEFRDKIGPFEASAWGGVQILNQSYSVLLFFAATLNWIAAAAVTTQRQVRRLAIANVVFCVMLMVIPLWQQFPPPAVFAAACAALFGVALLKSGPATDNAPRP